MNRVMSFMLAASLAIGLGCGTSKQTAGADAGTGGGGTDAQGTGGAGGQADAGTGGAGGLTLVGWVDDLADSHTNAADPPDTVDDKAGTIIDTDDPAAFDVLLGKQAP